MKCITSVSVLAVLGTLRGNCLVKYYLISYQLDSLTSIGLELDNDLIFFKLCVSDAFHEESQWKIL